MPRDYWQGDRIKLRAMIPPDIALFWSFDDEVSRNLDAVYWPQSEERLQAWFEAERSKQRTDDSFRWIAENAEGQVVGTIDTFACNRRFGTFKYGIALASPYQGKGYGREMIFLVLCYYFHELRYQKVSPHVYSFNTPSMKLHEKMGFKKEGQLRNMAYTNGQFFDEIHYGMTRDEFDQLFQSELHRKEAGFRGKERN